MAGRHAARLWCGMAAFDRISHYYGAEAVAKSRTLDLHRLSERDPHWEFMLENGALEVGFEYDDMALVVHEGGAWAVIESSIQWNEPALFVLGAAATSTQAFREGAAYLEELAMHSGCRYICFGSMRPGWVRLGRKMGYEPDDLDGYYVKVLHE